MNFQGACELWRRFCRSVEECIIHNAIHNASFIHTDTQPKSNRSSLVLRLL